ncbi:MAG: hypothetical protein QMC81_02015 [Thermoanaerobacterales bacterium]|nr:hypothetical protein [Thermoanaerobacterales bacterium]
MPWRTLGARTGPLRPRAGAMRARCATLRARTGRKWSTLLGRTRGRGPLLRRLRCRTWYAGPGRPHISRARRAGPAHGLLRRRVRSFCLGGRRCRLSLLRFHGCDRWRRSGRSFLGGTGDGSLALGSHQGLQVTRNI